MKLYIKPIISILLFICLAKMPYGFYQAVRFISFIGFILLAYYASAEKKNELMILYIGGAILFNPIFKINLGRNIWQAADVIIGLLLIIKFIQELKLKSK